MTVEMFRIETKEETENLGKKQKMGKQNKKHQSHPKERKKQENKTKLEKLRGLVTQQLATCIWKPDFPGSSPAANYVQR